MADLARIKNNVRKMVAQNAPESDIDEYIASEGVNLDAVRSFRSPHREFDGSNIPGYDPETGMVVKNSNAYSALTGATDVLSAGFADEAAAGLVKGIETVRGNDVNYEDIVRDMRGQQSSAYNDNPKSYIGGMVAGGVGAGVGLAGSGLSVAGNALARGAALPRVAGASALDGAIFGGASGFGSGEGLSDRLMGGAIGAGAGAALGGAAPFVAAGTRALVSPVVSSVMSRMRPESYANAALGEGLRRSGSSVDEVADALLAARGDGQGMFNVADAMGNSGQRLLSTVARNPHEGRQAVVEALQARQMGQGERLSNFLAEGFDAPDTAAQRAATLTGARDTAADAAYGAARQNAGPVDVSRAVAAIDDVLQPGVNSIVSPGSNIANDTVEGALSRARSMLTDGRSNLTDFNAVLRAKQDIDDMIGAAVRGGRNNQARLLGQVKTELDDALAGASAPYAGARDAFREGSRTIEAVDTGRAAASGRTRAADNIDQFSAMTPEQQQAFRAGYVDPIIAKVEGASISPTTNKARPLMTEKTGQEFPAFAAPGRADQLGTRIGREQRMFETANTALGGSKTADNLADAAEMAKHDPGVMAKLLTGRPIQAIIEATTQLVNTGRGMPPRVIEQVGRVLMETDPQAARAFLTAARANQQGSAARQAVVNAILTTSGAGGAARLP